MKKTSSKEKQLGRKFWAFVLSLVAIVVCAIFSIDVSAGVGTVFGIYCVGNVGTKWVQEHGVLQDRN